jgi:hypothetical protein
MFNGIKCMLCADPEITLRLQAQHPYWLAMNRYVTIRKTLLSGSDGNPADTGIECNLHLDNLLIVHVSIRTSQIGRRQLKQQISVYNYFIFYLLYKLVKLLLP